MIPPFRLFILAGEHSGDRLGADLIARLRARSTVTLCGVGGDEMAAQGLASLFPMSDLSVMGLWDVLKRLPLLLWRVRQTAAAIARFDPDLVVLIDSQEFSKLVAKRLRRRGFRRPVLLYVAPTVWGRAPERARKLRPLFDEVLSVLPFEPAVMRELGGPETSYVGHPAVRDAQASAEIEGNYIALLPGSRKGEIRRHLPLLKAVASALAREGKFRFFIPTLPDLAVELRQSVSSWQMPVEIIDDRAARADLYRETMCSVSAAGTATLELALAGVPMVVTYLMEGPQAREYERLGHPKVSLPNIILRNGEVPEVLLLTPDPGPLVDAARRLVGDKGARKAQRNAFLGLRQQMEEGLPEAPRCDPAERVLAHLPV